MQSTHEYEQAAVGLASANGESMAEVITCCYNPWEWHVAADEAAPAQPTPSSCAEDLMRYYNSSWPC